MSRGSLVAPVARLPADGTDTIVWGERARAPNAIADERLRARELVAHLPATPEMRSAGRATAIGAAVLLSLLAVGAVLLIALDPGRRPMEEKAHLTDADDADPDTDGSPAEAFPLIAIEPSRFAGIQGPGGSQSARNGRPARIGSDAAANDAVDVEVLALPDPNMEATAAAAAGVVVSALPAPSFATGLSTGPGASEEPVQPTVLTRATPRPASPGSATPGSATSAAREAVDPTLLMDRGSAFWAQSDVSSARLFFRLAAEQGSAAGAMAMAMTYDPLKLTGAETGSARADPTAAVEWYHRAAELGERDAGARAARLIDALGRRAADGDAEAKTALHAIGP